VDIVNNFITLSMRKKYEAELSSAHEGIALNKESFYVMNDIVSEGIRKGQHLHLIIIIGYIIYRVDGENPPTLF